MKKLQVVILVGILLSINNLLFSLDLQTREIKVEKKVIELLNTWNKDIWFFTSKNNPIRTLDNLKKEDFACWGAELIQKVFAFLDNKPKSLDEISEITNIPVQKVSETLLGLELKKMVKVLPGENFVRA